MYFESILTKRFVFKYNEIKSDNINSFVEHHLKREIEGICIAEGFVKKKTVKVIAISSGLIKRSNVIFDVTFSCELYVPMKDAIIQCKVASVTKAGIRAFSAIESFGSSPFIAFVTKDLEFEDEIFETIQEGDIFTAKIMGFRYELNDKHVSIIGEFISIETEKEVQKEKSIVPSIRMPKTKQKKEPVKQNKKYVKKAKEEKL